MARPAALGAGLSLPVHRRLWRRQLTALFFGCAPSTCRAVLPVSNVECRITAATPGECETCPGREGKVKFICRRDAFDA
jgi:hypothetical protein